MIRVGSVDDPNLAILSPVTRALDDLIDELVFVGGCATGLLITTVRSELIRATTDVDVLVEVASLADYQRAESRLRERGFSNDLSPDAPICRWNVDGLKLDLMPTANVLGFHNRWYSLAAKTAQWCELPDGTQLRLIAAPVFIATKLEAFRSRGKSDYLASHDLEDVLTIVDGRPELLDEVGQYGPELASYLGAALLALLAEPDFLQAIPGHLPTDRASQGRVVHLMDRLERLSRLT